MKKKICLILADYYHDVAKLLAQGAIKKIREAESKGLIKKTFVPSHDMFLYVPGVFEIPVTISKLINKYDAFVALGCVIKGETPHFDLISRAVVYSIMDLSVIHKKPIGNGIITCLNKKQALERADPKGKNIGANAVSAVLRTLANFK